MIDLLLLGAFGGLCRHLISNGFKLLLPKREDSWLSLGFIGNIVVGLFLGFLTPSIAVIFGLPLDYKGIALVVGYAGSDFIENLFERIGKRGKIAT